jgi:hypothetical protein
MVCDAAHGVVYAGTVSSGLYRSVLSSSNGVPTSSAPISACSLGQNYPNPFSSMTTLNYSIDRSSDVQLDVIDITGKSVASLVNGHVSPGKYSVTLDVSNMHLADGIYLCRLQCDGVIVTQRIIHHSF